MLFKPTLDKYRQEVHEAVRELFDAIEENQTHENDLLLILINAQKNRELITNPKLLELKLSGFLLGGVGGFDYYSDYTQYEFYDFYRKSNQDGDLQSYLKKAEKDKGLMYQYKMILQLELMIYLKFWESTYMLKKLYHFSNLAIGNNFDWYFHISKDDSRHSIIRDKTRDVIKKQCPKYYALVKDLYLSQIRNAVAHSQFSIFETHIHWDNYDPKNHSPLSQTTFEDWEVRFHKFTLFYDELIGAIIGKSEYYKQQVKGKQNGLQVRMTEEDGSEKFEWVKYDERSRWGWAQNFKNR